MNVNLGTQWETFIDDSVKTGRYLSASEVVRDGLRLLQEREQLRQIRLADLRKEVDKGIEALDRGEAIHLDQQGMKDYLKNVTARGRQQLGRHKANAE